ncbi:hypothetical protein LT336_00812 [Spiroplasma sp. JKS002671]|uniref:lipoprotein n=1 Tax=Spiroplasma attinicola TaxID=2904537 RepID=UPI002022B250|nr:lipoprotein [Spiroplasma sp. JKS002671]MCL8211059.1 hypothetical protein [Spiroplasma sp. JKS002671]
MKKILSILSTLSLTTLVSTTVIACNNQDENQIGIIPILNETLAKLEKETAFNPYDWTKDTLDETIKSDFLNYLQKHVKNFDAISIINLKISRDNMFNQIIININYQDKKQNSSQPYFIKTGILLEGE